MLEPISISVPNLAARWNQTPSDILEHAANVRLHLLFNFDGLVFDFNDDWLPGGKDWKQRRELQTLTDFVKRANAKFKRRAAGQLSQWESLDSNEAVSLRAEVTAKEKKIQALSELFDDRDRKRQKKHYRGYLMAAPATVDELKRLGFAVHPIRAYRPEGPFTLRKVDGVLVLDGPIVRLEAGIAQWKERLEPADMVVSMADVKAIEAAAKPQQTAPATQAAPKVTSTLFDSGLSVREFKTHLLNVPDLLEWAKSKRFHLRTTPPLDGYEFVHIETLLCAIERHAMSLTHEQARNIVANHHALQARMSAGLGVEREAFDNYVQESPAWLVQADAHSQWRKLFAAAIKAGELVLLDFGSKLPIDPVPAQNTATPAHVARPTETKEQRQDRRLQACIDAGLPMDSPAALLRLPDGVGNVADSENVTRQAFSTDVKAALTRLGSAIREGRTVHRA